MQWNFLIHFLKTVFHVVIKDRKKEYVRRKKRNGCVEDMILRFFLVNELFSGIE